MSFRRGRTHWRQEVSSPGHPGLTRIVFSMLLRAPDCTARKRIPSLRSWPMRRSFVKTTLYGETGRYRVARGGGFLWSVAT